jgi:hypothetical protein
MCVVYDFDAVARGHVLVFKILVTECGESVTKACPVGGWLNITRAGGSFSGGLAAAGGRKNWVAVRTCQKPQ